MAGERARKPDEQRHIGRRFLPVLVLRVAIGKVHADADNFFGGRNRDLIGKTVSGMRQRATFGRFFQGLQTRRPRSLRAGSAIGKIQATGQSCLPRSQCRSIFVRCSSRWRNALLFSCCADATPNANTIKFKSRILDSRQTLPRCYTGLLHSPKVVGGIYR